MKLRISLIPTEYISMVWPDAQPLLAKAMPYSNGRYSTAALLDEVMAGRHNLWVAFEEVLGEIPIVHAAFTTSFVTYPLVKGLSCQFCGGANMDEWIDEADEILSRFAADNACSFIELTGRDGWLKKLPSSWSPEFRVYRRNLSEKESAKHVPRNIMGETTH